jgi:lysophospholipase L1-like esterase
MRHSDRVRGRYRVPGPRRFPGPAALRFAVMLTAAAGALAAPGKGQNPVPQPLAQQVAALEERVARQERVLLDWPNLARYREANAKVTPPADEARVVFLGDSITDMWVLPKFGEFFPGKPYLGRGIGGQTTPQMLLRFRSDVIALKPAVVVILAGTNDIAGNTGPMSLEDIEANLTSMAELARANGIRLVLSSVLPVYDGGRNADGALLTMSDHRPLQKIVQLNQWIRNYAAEHDEVYVDYFSAMADEQGFLKKELSEDGLHPNRSGYAVMAPLAEKAIAEALRKNAAPKTKKKH